MKRWIVCGVALVVLSAGLALGAEKQIIRPAGTKPGGNYSPGILVDGTLYISGQAGEDAEGKIPGEYEAEAKQPQYHMGAVLNAAGMSPANVVSVHVYLTDAATFQRMTAVYTNRKSTLLNSSHLG